METTSFPAGSPEALNWFFLFMGLAYLLAVAVDGLVLTLARFKPAKAAFVDAIIVNLASSGAVLVLFMSDLLLSMGATAFLVVVPLVFIVVEGIVLNSRRLHNSALRTWGLTAGMNLVCYGLIHVFLLFIAPPSGLN